MAKKIKISSEVAKEPSDFIEIIEESQPLELDLIELIPVEESSDEHEYIQSVDDIYL